MEDNFIPWLGERFRIQGLFLINESETIIKFNGYQYKKNKFGYWLGGSSGSKSGDGSLHRAIWKYQKGEIPKKYDVHHIDGNKSNNSIENLQLISHSDHMRMHMSTAERKELSRKHIGKAIEASKSWHSSEEGLKWHSKHGKECFEKKKLINKSCHNCEKVFQTVQNFSKYCSPTCQSSFRRKSGKDNEERHCEVCYEKFICNRYDTKKSCSASCGTMLGHRKRSLRSYNRK